MTNSISIYNFNQNQIRTQLIDDEPYFCGVDVCNTLGIKNNNNVISRLKEGVHTMDTLTNGGIQQLKYISESNLYKVAFQSRKPTAEPFVNWVCKEVLPSIRKTGTYSVQPALPQSDGLSEKARHEIGGIVKRCCAVAVKEAFEKILANKKETNDKNLVAELGVKHGKQSTCTTELAKAIINYGEHERWLGKIEGALDPAFQEKWQGVQALLQSVPNA